MYSFLLSVKIVPSLIQQLFSEQCYVPDELSGYSGSSNEYNILPPYLQGFFSVCERGGQDGA